MATSKSVTILFVEGETEKEFYNALLKFYRTKSKTKVEECRIYNVKGVSRFENTVTGRLKYLIIPHYPKTKLKIICCYDSDVFELAQKPPTNWKIVKQKVNDLGIADFYEVKAVRMIEDWFLKDYKGLGKYLNIEVPRHLDGKNGHEKLKRLFKIGKKPKVYQKGTNSHKFIPFLNMHSIRNEIKTELSVIEKSLGVSL